MSESPTDSTIETTSSFVAWPLAVGVVLLSNLITYCVNENGRPARLLVKLLGRTCSKSSFHTTRTVTGRRTHPRPVQYWAFDVLCPSDVVCSALVPLPVLLLWRVGVLAHFGVSILVDALDDGIRNDYLLYFTHWTLVGMGVQGLVSTVVTALHVRQRESEMTWNFGLKLMLVLEQTIPTSALFLTLFYWVALYDPDNESVSGSNLLKHGINVVVMLFSFLFSKIPFVSYHIQFTIYYMTAYTFVMWVYAEATGVWSYSVLDYSEATSLIYYSLVPVLLVICFYIWFLLGMLRDVISYQCCKRDEFLPMTTTKPAVPGAISSSLAAHRAPQTQNMAIDEEAQ